MLPLASRTPSSPRKEGNLSTLAPIGSMAISSEPRVRPLPSRTVASFVEKGDDMNKEATLNPMKTVPLKSDSLSTVSFDKSKKPRPSSLVSSADPERHTATENSQLPIKGALKVMKPIAFFNKIEAKTQEDTTHTEETDSASEKKHTRNGTNKTKREITRKESKQELEQRENVSDSEEDEEKTRVANEEEEEEEQERDSEPAEDKVIEPPPSSAVLDPDEGLYNTDLPIPSDSLSIPPKICIPRTTNDPVFVAVLEEDASRLAEYLSALTPSQVLTLRDRGRRSLFHYAALSKSVQVRKCVFMHAQAAITEENQQQIDALVVRAAESLSVSSQRYNPTPRIQELRRLAKKQLRQLLFRSVQLKDQDDRTWFHYAFSRPRVALIHELIHWGVVEMEQVVKKHHRELLFDKDRFDWNCLQYAVVAGNNDSIAWLFARGVGETLTRPQVDDLLRLGNGKRTVLQTLVRALKKADAEQYYHHQQKRRGGTEEEEEKEGMYTEKGEHTYELGISSYAEAQLLGDLDAVSSSGLETPLHQAARYGNVTAAQRLIQNGANVEAADANGWTPLHYCAAGSSLKHEQVALELLRVRTGSIEARSVKGRTPLHLASLQNRQIQHGSTRFVSFLLENGANIDALDLKNNTPLHLAARNGHVMILELLLRAGCNRSLTNSKGWSCLHVAAACGQMEAVAFLSRWDVEFRCWIDLKDYHGDSPALVAQNQAIKAKLNSLWHACFKGDSEQVREFLRQWRSSGARERKDPVWNGPLSVRNVTFESERTALHVLILGILDNNRHTSLPSSSSSSTPRGRTTAKTTTTAASMMKPVPACYLQSLTHLLEADVEVGKPDKWGITPLMLGAMIPQEKVMETLLTYADKNDVARTDTRGNTALHYAYAFCNGRVTTTLEENCSDPEWTNTSKSTPFDVSGDQEALFPPDYQTFLQTRTGSLPIPSSSSNPNPRRK